MAVARYKTAGAVINGAARELGLPVPPDPFASADPNHQQLVQLLNTLGLSLVDAFDWEHLMALFSFPTVAGLSAYDLPGDYHKPRDETQWNMTSQIPLIGPLTPQAWQERLAMVGQPSVLEFRLTTNQILLSPVNAIPNAQTLHMEYKSRAWVRPAASGLGNGNTLGTSGTDEVVAFGDYPLFEPLVLHYGLKLLWRAAKQFDVQINLVEFVRALDDAKGRSAGAKSLSYTPMMPRNRDA